MWCLNVCTQRANFPRGEAWFKPLEGVAPARMHAFTAVQCAALGFAWVLNGLSMADPGLSPLGLCFPVVIMALVPFRRFLMPRFFEAEDLERLDGVDHDKV